MKIFEMPNIEVIAFTAESIMDVSNSQPSVSPTTNNQLPWA